ncbi:MAG: hypothetical protein CM1200mP33_6010 [Chloroflexota bacterium]|nr:MAG: hypothetical protein CM1200mP33_6010 [Chloroflexota bacterium]
MKCNILNPFVYVANKFVTGSTYSSVILIEIKAQNFVFIIYLYPLNVTKIIFYLFTESFTQSETPFLVSSSEIA